MEEQQEKVLRQLAMFDLIGINTEKMSYEDCVDELIERHLNLIEHRREREKYFKKQFIPHPN